ncbi:MAG: BREX system ATP-binding domain-containing protein [Euryarchaeota archaeon]|nr:BREX system ATP-binding domain-containing protein [Euryarchaeota archaeon]
MKENSPFTPGNPAPVELFVGRVEQIEEILRYVRQTASGRQENVFLAGERGIGKSSLAAFLRYLVNRENFLAIHVFLGGVTDLEELVRRIFELNYIPFISGWKVKTSSRKRSGKMKPVKSLDPRNRNIRRAAKHESPWTPTRR